MPADQHGHTAVHGKEPIASFTAEPQRRRPGIPVNSIETKLRQLVDSRKVNGDPAIRFAAEWSAAAPSICAEWIRSAEAHDASAVSHIALSRMKALQYERKHRHQLASEQRLFPELRTKQDFHHAQVRAFLDAVREDADAVLQSFNYIGQGGLHRKNANAAWSFKALLTTIRRLVPDPVTKVALSATELAVEAVVAQQVIASADVRFRIAQTEKIMPDGKADASPSAKNAPTILKTSQDVIWKLRHADRLVGELFAAQQAVERARSRFLQARSSDGTGSTAAKRDLEEARNELELLFAKHCYHRQLRAAHKAGFENLKKEFFGNAGYFSASNTVNAMVLTSGLLAILTPAVLSAVVTGGVTAAVLGVAVLIYLGYHFSSGPSKDGARKAKRQVLALAKSVDILTQESRPSHQHRAESYRQYRGEMKQARRLPVAQREEAERNARAEHLARLRTITQNEPVPADRGAHKNWEEYGRYCKRLADPSPAADAAHAARMQEHIDAEYEAELNGSFRTDVVSKAWKTSIGMRVDAAHRLVRGKIADLHERLIDLDSKRFSVRRVFKSSAQLRRKKDDLQQRLQQAVFDAINLELADQRVTSARQASYATPELRATALRDAAKRSAAALAAVKDDAVRQLFCGDAETQVRMAHKADLLQVGERDRYFYPNLSNAVFAIGTGTVLGITNTAVTDLKMEKKLQLTYNNQEFARILPAGAGVYSPHNASARDEYRHRDGPRVASKLRAPARREQTEPRDAEAATLRTGLEDDGRECFDPDDPVVADSVNAFVTRLLREPAVPEAVMLLKRPDTSGSVNPEPDIQVDLTKTEAFYRSRYRNLPTVHGLPGKERLRVAKAKIKIVAKHALVGIGGLVAQPLAQFNIRKTRAGFEQAAERLPEIERGLHESADSLAPLSAVQISTLESNWAATVDNAIAAAGARAAAGTEVPAAPVVPNSASDWAASVSREIDRIGSREESRKT